MKNNKIGKIAIKTPKIKRSQLNLAHDVSTSAGWGDVQPTTCKLIIPKSSGTIQSKCLVRLAPMVAPTFGRVKAKEYHTLVPISDLSRNAAALLAQSQLAKGTNVFTPENLPFMTLGFLSRYCLIGSTVTAYREAFGNNDTSMRTVQFRPTNETRQLDYASQLDLSTYFFDDYHSTEFPGYVGGVLDLDIMTRDWALNMGISQQLYAGNLKIPVRNRGQRSFFGTWTRQVAKPSGVEDEEYEDVVPLDKADLCYTFQHNGHMWTFAFRLSSFGKRLRKAIIGAGYQINLTSTAKVCFLQLFAVWKAWFDLFGLTLFDNYETTNLSALKEFMDFHNVTNLDGFFNRSEFVRFICDLGNMWYTDGQDVVSAHMPSTAISPSFGLSRQFIDVDGGANITEVDNPMGQQENGHSFINNIEHGQLDAEYLMKLYRWVNRNTVAGKAIEKVLRAQGLGDYVDSCKSNFIGYHEEMVQVFDVVAQADTFKDGSGSLLGEYGGRGLKIYETRKNSFTTDEYCFQVSLFTIVPESGYMQAIDPSVYAIDKMSLFNPDFDGLGMEANRKTIVCGAENWTSEASFDDGKKLDDNFGFVPRYTGLKIGHNVTNGDFSLRGTRDAYLPYTLDKFIDVGERLVNKVDVGTAGDVEVFETIRTVTPKTVPTSGNPYRFPTRWPWLGNFNRIFANVGEPLDRMFYLRLHDNYEEQSATWEFLVNLYDNFMVHEIVNLQVYSPCKSIEESYETYDEHEQPNARIEKA